MEVLKLKGLEQLQWRGADCKVTASTCIQEPKSNPAASSGALVRMAIYGTVALELGSSRIRFGWKAQQLVEPGGPTGKHAFDVDFSAPACVDNVLFVDEAGNRLPLANYTQIAQWLARNTAPVWSETVAHYLKSLR